MKSVCSFSALFHNPAAPLEPVTNCGRFKTQVEVPIWNLKFSNVPAPKPVVGDSVNWSQFVTGWLPESRLHFATLNNGENFIPAGRKAAEGSRSPKREAFLGDLQTARSVMECASPLALSEWRQRFHFSRGGALVGGGGFLGRKFVRQCSIKHSDFEV
jgi:hypothetical protein